MPRWSQLCALLLLHLHLLFLVSANEVVFV